MTEGTSEATSGPPPSVDVQDPLPESAFLYRRIFSYFLSVALIALLALVVWRMDSAAELTRVALYLCLLLFMVVTYYMIAPSAEQVVKMLQTAKLLARGVTIEKSASADRTSATTRTRVGRGTINHSEPPRRPPPPEPSYRSPDAAPTSRNRR